MALEMQDIIDIAVPDPLRKLGIGTDNVEVSATFTDCVSGFWDLSIKEKEALFHFFIDLQNVKIRMMREEEKQFIVQNGRRLKNAANEEEFLSIVKELKAESKNLHETLMFREGDGNFRINFGRNTYAIQIGVRPRRLENFADPIDYIFICLIN